MTPATVAADTKISGVTVKPGIALTNDVLTFTFDSTNKTQKGSTSEKGYFDLTELKFENTGIYRYTVKEVSETADGTVTALPVEEEGKTYYVEYDYTEYVVDLYVSQDDTNGYYVANVSVTYADKEEKPAQILFENKINCANITIVKNVDGETYTKDEQFTFCIMIPEKGDTITLTEADTIQAQKYDANGDPSGDPMVLQTKGADITADLEANGNQFTLGDGEYLVITAPVSMIYKVHEHYYGDEDYTTDVEASVFGTVQTGSDKLMADGKYTDKDSEGHELVAIKETTNTATNEIVYTNTRKMTAPAGGINLDFIPYVLVLVLAAAAGGAVLVYKKRRTVR
jgi:hypothetical protein